jgi:hypothetical protein
MSLLNAVTSFQATASSNNGGAVTLPAGTNRKLMVGFTAETTSTITALTYNGTAFLSNLGIEAESSATAGNKSSIYWYDIPDVLDAGSYDLRWNQSSSSTARVCYAAMLVGAATGEPAWEGGTFLDGVGTGMSFNLTSVDAGAFILAVWQHSAGGVSVTWGADVTERFDASAGSYRSAQADADDVTAGTKTISTTASGSDAAYRQTLVAMAVAAAAVAGPTITVQPANDVGIISNGDSTVYTATATGTNVDAPTWSVDATPIADGGIYDIVTTGAGTSSCTSTLTITRTSKTGTPFDIVANFADDNGDTDTNTVTDTWWTGPVVTTFPATDGDGESEATLTCDYVTGVGEAIEVRIPLSDGDVAVTVTTTES